MLQELPISMFMVRAESRLGNPTRERLPESINLSPRVSLDPFMIIYFTEFFLFSEVTDTHKTHNSLQIQVKSGRSKENRKNT